jgi:hypothetical protein
MKELVESAKPMLLKASGSIDAARFAQLDVSVNGDNLEITSSTLAPKSIMRRSFPVFPTEIVEILKDLDQTVELDLQLGTSIEEIISDQKPVIDNLLQGFKARLSMNYIKNLKKILA